MNMYLQSGNGLKVNRSIHIIVEEISVTGRVRLSIRRLTDADLVSLNGDGSVERLLGTCSVVIHQTESARLIVCNISFNMQEVDPAASSLCIHWSPNDADIEALEPVHL